MLPLRRLMRFCQRHAFLKPPRHAACWLIIAAARLRCLQLPPFRPHGCRFAWSSSLRMRQCLPAGCSERVLSARAQRLAEAAAAESAAPPPPCCCWRLLRARLLFDDGAPQTPIYSRAAAADTPCRRWRHFDAAWSEVFSFSLLMAPYAIFDFIAAITHFAAATLMTTIHRPRSPTTPLTLR